jgi:LCP family protein required for cell wall assembly
VTKEHGVDWARDKLTAAVAQARGTTRGRLIAGITAAAVLLAAGVVVGFSIMANRLDQAIPQTDLFGSPSPSASTDPSLAPSQSSTKGPAIPAGADITGPLNILLAGHDMVPGEYPRDIPHADAVLILHIDATLTRAYLTSLPRDLLVNIPADPASGSEARSGDKLTHSMTYGSRVPGSSARNLAQGFALLARTVSQYTGIDHFDAGAVLSFGEMARLVDVMGGIDVYVDAPVTSIHMSPQGTSAWGSPGPFQTYPQGMQHLEGWQALDYSRQRYGVPGGAYGRERHITEVTLAMISKLFSMDLLRFSLTAPYLLASINDFLTIDLRGRQLHEYVYALRNLRPENVTLVALPGGSVSSGGSYVGEALAPIQSAYFNAVRTDTVADFLAANPSLINSPL